VLGQQVLADTGAELVKHPFKCTWDNICEMNEHLLAALQGLICKRLALGLLGPPGPLPPDRQPLDSDALEGALQRLTGKDLQPASVQLYTDGPEALAALYKLINRATRSIDVMMFYWENDPVGADVAKWLAAKAGPNLRVRVLVDGGGNLVFAQPRWNLWVNTNRVIAELTHHPYVEVVRIRNPFARFDHRKVVVVDGCKAWTGGRNFTDCAFFKQHDLSFTLSGPLASEMQHLFDNFWSEQGGEPERREKREERREKGKKDSMEENASARFVCTEPGSHKLAAAVYEAIDRASDHVYVENVYFSDSCLVYKLAQARRRGADVRVVITFSTSSKDINRANRVVANRLLRTGVRVYVYPIMTHVKAASVDGCWVYLGTGNFDPLSMRHNHELGIAVSSGPLIDEVEAELFQKDFRPEWELTKPLPLTWCDYTSEILASLLL
jgi:cardiolipin synthase